jgi:hypothetical protein
MVFGNNIDLIGVIYANFHEWKLKMLLDFHFLRKFNFYLSAKICLFSSPKNNCHIFFALCCLYFARLLFVV